MRIRSIASSIATRRVTCEELVERVRQASASSLPPRQIEKVIKRLRMLFRIAGSRDRYERGDGERSGNFVRRAAREALAKADLLPGDIETRPVCRRRSRLGGARHVELLHARRVLRALCISYHFLKNGAYKHILILNGEFNAGYGNWRITHPKQLDYRFAQ